MKLYILLPGKPTSRDRFTGEVVQREFLLYQGWESSPVFKTTCSTLQKAGEDTLAWLKDNGKKLIASHKRGKAFYLGVE
jgi:hypothetical protein